MGFKSSAANPDVWMIPACKPDNEHYDKYLGCYVENLLGVSMQAKDLLMGLQTEFKFKKDKVE